MNSVADTVVKWVGIGAALAAVVGGFAALYSYREDLARRSDDRKKEVLEFVRLFNTEEFMRIRTFTTSMIDKGIECDTSVVQGPERIRLFVYVDFFDSIYICVQNNLCDQHVVQEFFERYANYHWPALRRHIWETRAVEAKFEARTKYGVGLESLARSQLNVRSCAALGIKKGLVSPAPDKSEQTGAEQKP